MPKRAPTPSLDDVLSYTVQTQRSIMGRVFLRCDRRNTSQTKRRFFSLIPGLRPDKTVQYMNQKELMLVWRALAPLMDRIPDSWNIMMENDAAKLAVLRDDLDALLISEIERVSAEGGTMLPPGAATDMTARPRQRRPSPSAGSPPGPQGMAAPRPVLKPRAGSGRAAAKAAAAAMARVMQAADDGTDTDDAYSTDTDNCVDEYEPDASAVYGGGGGATVGATVGATAGGTVGATAGAAAFPPAAMPRPAGYPPLSYGPASPFVHPVLPFTPAAVPAAVAAAASVPPTLPPAVPMSAPAPTPPSTFGAGTPPPLHPLLAEEDLDGLDFDMDSNTSVADLMGAFSQPCPPAAPMMVPLSKWADPAPDDTGGATPVAKDMDSLYRTHAAYSLPTPAPAGVVPAAAAPTTLAAPRAPTGVPVPGMHGHHTGFGMLGGG